MKAGRGASALLATGLAFLCGCGARSVLDDEASVVLDAAFFDAPRDGDSEGPPEPGEDGADDVVPPDGRTLDSTSEADAGDASMGDSASDASVLDSAHDVGLSDSPAEERTGDEETIDAQVGCLIGGVLYASGDPNPVALCESCDPSASTTDWSSVVDGAACGSSGAFCCSGQCVQEQSDPGNCGACGNACDDGTGALCSDGRCTYVLAEGLDAPTGIAVDATNVYFTEDILHQVGKVSIRGGAVTTLASDQDLATGIAVDARNVYWTNEVGGGSVLSLPLGGGTPETLVSGRSGPSCVAVEGTNVYFSDTSVNAVPIGGGAVVTLSASGSPLSVAVDAENVYWTIEQTAVMKVPLGGGTAVTLALGDNPSRIAVNATSVFWTDTIALTVMTVPIGGGALVTLAADSTSTPVGIAADEDHVYWTAQFASNNNFAVSAVMAVPVGGGIATTIASQQSSPDGIALDADYVYWTNYSDGTIRKAQKR